MNTPKIIFTAIALVRRYLVCLFTVEARVRAQASPRGIADKVALERGFLRVLRCSMFTPIWTKGPLQAQFLRDIVSSCRNNSSNNGLFIQLTLEIAGITRQRSAIVQPAMFLKSGQ
jgi:hypothetical protein